MTLKVKHFTLIEILSVIVILSILAAIVIPNIKDFQKEAIISNMNSSIQSVQTAVDKYAFDNNGVFPADTQPSIENPVFIDFDKLYPKYIKKKPDTTKIKDQKFWVDSMGKVWGSTIDAPASIFESDSYVEWKNSPKTVSYKLYKINDEKVTSKASNSRWSLLKEIPVTSATDLLQMEKGEDTYLISSVDQYNLETAPVGVSHVGEQDWFQPIRSKEGTSLFDLIADEPMYFDGFSKFDNKPEGTSIVYEFATEEDNFQTFETDIKKLPPSKHLKVKITTKSFNGKSPSVYNMMVHYHFSREEVDKMEPIRLPLDKAPESMSKTTGSIYQGTLPTGMKFVQLDKPFGVIATDSTSSETIKYGFNSNSIEIWYIETGTSTARKATSLNDIPAGADYFIWIDHSKTETITNAPVVTMKENPITLNVEKGTTSTSPTQPKSEWDDVQTLTFMASTEDGQVAKWTNAEYEDKKPENTRIIYKFSTSNGFGWSSEVDSISKLSASKMIRVRAYLQVNNTVSPRPENPEVVNIRIYNERGYSDLSMVKPTVAIKMSKDNNGSRETISTSSKITWSYDAIDPRSKEITNVEWTTNKAENYPTVGTYKIGVRVQNESGYWSDWNYISITVVEETPTATIDLVDDTFLTGYTIDWKYKFQDPDGDSIKSVEWTTNKKDRYDTTGSYKVGLRIQDEDGNWSNWNYKDITIIAAPDVTTENMNNLYHYFNGTTASYMKNSAITNFPANGFTLEFTLLNSTVKPMESIFSYATSANFNEVLIEISGGYLGYTYQGTFTKTNIAIKNNEAHHYVITYDVPQKRVKIYEDKELVWDKVHSNMVALKTSGSIFIGQDQDSVGGGLAGDQSFNGFFKEVRLWNTVLPKSFLDTLYGKSVTNTSPYLLVNVSANNTAPYGVTASNTPKYTLDQQAAPNFTASTSTYVKKNVSGFPSESYTISFWMNKSSTYTATNHMFSYATSTSDNSVLIREYGGKLSMIMQSTTLSTNVPISANQWTHVAVTWDYLTGTTQFYKNGVLTQTMTGFKTKLNPTGSIVLGLDQDTVGGGFSASDVYSGSLKHVNVYNGVLSANAIQEDMAGKTAPALHTQLIPYKENVWDVFYKNKNGIYTGTGFFTN